MTTNEKLIERIDNALPGVYDPDDRSVLSYVKTQLDPERVKEREEIEEGQGNVAHLVEVAKQRLRPYEARMSAVTADAA